MIQLHADRLTEDQGFYLSKELNDTAVTNILGNCIIVSEGMERVSYRRSA